MISASDDKLANELFSAFDEVIIFLDEHKNRLISLVQTRILLNSKKNLVVKTLNAFTSEKSQSAEYMIEVIFKVLDMATKITYRIPMAEELDKVRLEYQSLTNYLRMVLANIHQDSNLAQSFSTASILSNLLIDEMPVIDELPVLPEIDEDPFPFLEMILPYSNFFQSTWGIYETLISFLPLISLKSLIEWTNIMVKNTKLHWEIVENVDVIKILETRKIKEMDNFIDNLVYFGFTQLSMSLFMFEIFIKLDDRSRDKIDTMDLFESFNLVSLKKFLIKTKLFIESKKDMLQQAFKSLLIDRNDNPEKRESIINLNFYLQDVELVLKIIEYYENRSYDNTDLISEINTHNTIFLQNIANNVGGEENLVNSFYVSSFLAVLHDSFPFVAKLSVLKNDPVIYENFRFEHRYVIDRFPVENDAPLYFMKKISKLYVYTHFDKEIDFDKLFDEYNKNLDHFLLKPRLYLAMCVQMIIFSFLSETKNSEDRYKIFLNIEFNEILSDTKSITACDFKKYQTYINAIDSGEDVKIELDNRDKIYPMDHVSLLIPDFSKYFERKGMVNIKYYPFNLGFDSVLDNIETN